MEYSNGTIEMFNRNTLQLDNFGRRELLMAYFLISRATSDSDIENSSMVDLFEREHKDLWDALTSDEETALELYERYPIYEDAALRLVVNECLALSNKILEGRTPKSPNHDDLFKGCFVALLEWCDEHQNRFLPSELALNYQHYWWYELYSLVKNHNVSRMSQEIFNDLTLAAYDKNLEPEERAFYHETVSQVTASKHLLSSIKRAFELMADEGLRLPYLVGNGLTISRSVVTAEDFARLVSFISIMEMVSEAFVALSEVSGEEILRKSFQRQIKLHRPLPRGAHKYKNSTELQ